MKEKEMSLEEIEAYWEDYNSPEAIRKREAEEKLRKLNEKELQKLLDEQNKNPKFFELKGD